MEVAGGAIGAVGLGIQLVGTVRKVMTFIQSIQDAPEDLARLGSRVKQLETILHRVTTLVESRSQYTDTSGSVDLLEEAVRNCEPNVTKLGKLVDKLQKKSDQSGKRRAAWTSLKSVVKKEDLDKYRSLIQESLMALNTAIAFGAFEINLQQVAVARAHRSLDSASAVEHSALAQDSDPPLVQGEEEQAQDIRPTSTWMVPGRKRGRRNVTFTVSTARSYQGFFGYICVKTKTTHLSGKQEGTTPISEEVGYLLRPAFLRFAIEIHTGGKLSRSLRYYPILQEDLEIFRICYRGDLEGFRQALTRQEVPIHAQISNGWTLLHMACLGGNLELCSLLMELGVDAGHEDIFGRKALHIFSNSFYVYHSVEAMVRLMILGQEHVEENDVIKFMEYYKGPPQGVEFLLSPDVHPTELDWRRLPLPHVVGIVTHFARDVPRWSNLVRRIVRQAEDLHCWRVDSIFASDQSLTLLDELFGETSDPIEGAQVSEAWLEILAMEGLDVREYLEVEMRLHEDKYTLPHRYMKPMKRFLIFNLEQKLTVEWDWWIDPDDPASLLCNEFKHMACRFDYRDQDGEWVKTWPFVIPKWAGHLGWESSYYAENPLWKHMIDLADSRAAHRLAKREMKIARAKGTYSRKLMPGSWIA